MKEFNQENQETASLYSQAEILRETYSHTKDLVLAVGEYLAKHGFTIPNRYEPKSILESRFVSAEDAFSKGMYSCGAIATMSAAMLRHVGLKVKLVHGEWSESIDHAWISVLDPESDTWADYDLTRYNPLEMPTHVEKARTDSWEDIREIIEHDHETFQERSRARWGAK